MSNLKPRTASVLIYQGDDLAVLGELRQAAEVAQRRVDDHERAVQNGKPQRVGDESPSADAEKAAYDAFVEEAAERALTVEIRAIGRKRFRDLLTEHPPREVEVTQDGKTSTETHPDDAGFDVNTSTFPDALLAFVDGDVKTIAQPEFPTRAACQEFIDDELADGDYETLWTAAYWLNRGPSADPKASKYASQSSTET